MKKLTFISILVVVIGTCFTVSAFAEFYVIPVNNKCGPCKGTRSAEGRWCDNGDGTITDMTTCLVWLKYADWGGQKPWEDCSTHDDAHTRAGLLASGETISTSGETVYLTDDSAVGDWRLPTKTELVGITTGNEYVRHGTGGQLFEEVQTVGYWSSSTDASDTSKAWYVQMHYGDVSTTVKDGDAHVWPVRSDD